MKPIIIALAALAGLGSLVSAQTSSAAFPLVKQDPFGRGGVVHVRSNASGVIVDGDVTGLAPRWPASSVDLARAEHIDVWLADTAPPRLPPVGWGNQFDWEFITRDADCSTAPRDTTAQSVRSCLDWFHRQTAARPTAARLFVRRWSVTPSFSAETFAKPAFASLESNVSQALSILEPSGSVRATFTTNDRGYHFEITLPWSALPPLRTTQLAALRMLVDVYSPGTNGALLRSTTNAAAVAGETSSFSLVSLSIPRRYAGPCSATFAQPLTQNGTSTHYLEASDSAVVYFRPEQPTPMQAAIVLDVPAHGYQYEPDPSMSALVANAMSFWALKLGDGEIICGPHLAYERAGAITRSEAVVDLPDSVATRRLSPNDLLVRAGPVTFSSYYGSGQCGGCARVRLDLFHLDRATGALTSAFSYIGIAEPDVTDVDVELSPDWREVTVFEGVLDNSGDSTVTRWRAKTHCYSQATHKYDVCRERDGAVPPRKRRIIPANPPAL